LLAAIGGDKTVVEYSFVENNLTAAPFFSTAVRFSTVFGGVFL
jgi:hypothetical protein